MSFEVEKPTAAEAQATEAEVEAAIRSLTPVQLVRLERYAQWRVRELGPRPCAGRTHVDLLGDAIVATLEHGRRTWKKGRVDFVRHLLSTMRSISSHWPTEARRAPVPTSRFEREGREGRVSSVLDEVRVDEPGAQDVLESVEELDARKQLVEAIDNIFEGDKVVTEIIGGIKAGMTGPEIREVLGLTQTEYETAMKRLRRTVRSRMEWSTNNG